jgi:uncharacterized linocin/CFP29 family protein
MPQGLVKGPAQVDFIHNGIAHGDVATKLLRNNMDVNCLRTNDTLRKDQWKQMSDQVVKIATERLVGIGDLARAGLDIPIENGLGTTIYEYEDESDMNPAILSMDGLVKGQNDTLEYTLKGLPLPIVHKDFQIGIRKLEASRRGASPLDFTQAQIASRKVAEKIEDILFNGASAYTFGTYTIRGYTDATTRNTGSLTAAWDSATGAQILGDVQSMIQSAFDDLHYGPFMLYVPGGYMTALGDDYKAESDKTIRQRLMDLEGIRGIRVSQKLAADQVVLVEMQAETVQVVNAMPVTVVQWETHGGMLLNFKVMAIMIPLIRADQEGRSGLQHYSV